jgi:putative tryptophan/tyrosine transport system substrate-binding protein
MPLSAWAQQPDRMRRIGVLASQSADDPVAQARNAAFLQGLRALGWMVGHNVQIEYRWASGDGDRSRKNAAEMVALAPDVILATGGVSVGPSLQMSRTLPIVFVQVTDPVGAGYVESLARPGGNATGFTNVEASLGGKWVELLKEINPRIARIGVLWDPQTSPGGGSYYLRLVQDAARSIAVETIAIPVHNSADIERAIEAFARAADAGLLVQPDVTIHSNRALIISLAARYRLPAVYTFPFYATEGGLASYGIEPVDLYRRAAPYVDRILRGAKPSDLPVQAPTKFELVINLKTAKALGIDIPPTLLARADEVIE